MPTTQQRRRLDGLIGVLQFARADKEEADRDGARALALDFAGAIRTAQNQIRRHCLETGLRRPADVPETD
jgi:hypothetical protein